MAVGYADNLLVMPLVTKAFLATFTKVNAGRLSRSTPPVENDGAKVVHGSGGILTRRGRSKTLPSVASDAFWGWKVERMYTVELRFTLTIGVPC